MLPDTDFINRHIGPRKSETKEMIRAIGYDTIEELVKNLDMQRQFEINVKLIKKASDIDSAGTKLMSLPT